ncbi:MAG: GNAT family N-acetyltransferase [Actinomycetota bacterium]
MFSIEELGINEVKAALTFLEREPVRNLRIIWALRRWGLFNLGLPEQGRCLASGDSGRIKGLLFINNQGLWRWSADRDTSLRLIESAVNVWGEPEALAGPEDEVEAVLEYLGALPGCIEHAEREISLILVAGNFSPVSGRARKAGEDDLPDLVKLEKGLQEELLGCRSAEWVIRSHMRRTIEDDASSLVRWNGKAVAKAAMEAQTPGADELGGVYTLPGYRRRGFASSACSLLCRLSLSEGKKIRLETQRDNAAALDFYRRLGFHELFNHLFIRLRSRQ